MRCVMPSGGMQHVGPDLSDVAATIAALERCAQFDILVNNTGTNRIAPFTEVGLDDFDVVFPHLRITRLRYQGHTGKHLLVVSLSACDIGRTLVVNECVCLLKSRLRPY
jgi:hypothetical protein